MQRNCIFPGRYAPLTYYDWLRGRPRNTLMARNAREICNFFVCMCASINTRKALNCEALSGTSPMEERYHNIYLH